VSGEQIILSNADLLRSRLRNFGRMDRTARTRDHRIAYETPREKVEQVGGHHRGGDPRAAGNSLRALATSRNWVPTRLNFEAVYFVLQPKLDALMDAQHGINLDCCARSTHTGSSWRTRPRNCCWRIPARTYAA